MSCHPHCHFVVPAGGVGANGEWVWPVFSENRFLFPVHAPAKISRGKFIAGLKRAYAKGTLQFPGDLAHLAEETGFEAWLDAMVSKHWVVSAKAPFAGPEQDECETVEEFWEEMELPAEEFIHRFLHHVLPSGYHRIRDYGFLSGGQKHRLQAIWEELMFEEAQPTPEVSVTFWFGLPCPVCEIGCVETRLAVNRRGQVVYRNPRPLHVVPMDWDRVGLESWETS